MISLYNPGTAFCTTTIGSMFSPVESTETLFVILSREIASLSPFSGTLFDSNWKILSKKVKIPDFVTN